MGKGSTKQSGVPRLSQSVVVDPASDLQETKEHIAAKGGIAPKEQRLLFARAPESPCCGSGRPPDSSLRTLLDAKWEGVLYENDRAVGRLVQPTVDLVLLEHLDSIPQVSGPTYILSFSFSTWIPPPSRGSPARRLSLRVKEGSPYRVQVFSKSRQGTVAWPPSVYKFTGEKIYSAARFQQQFDNHRQRHHTVQQQQHTAAGASGDPLPDLAVLGLIKVSDGTSVEFCNIVCKQAEGHVNLEEVNLRAAVCVRGESYLVVLGEMISQPQRLDMMPSAFHSFPKPFGNGSASSMFPSDGYFEDQQQPYSKPLFRPFSRPSLQKVPSGASCMPSSVATTGSAVDQQAPECNTAHSTTSGVDKMAVTPAGMKSEPLVSSTNMVQQAMNGAGDGASEPAHGLHGGTDIPCKSCNGMLEQSDSGCTGPDHSPANAVPATVSGPEEQSSPNQRRVPPAGTVVKQKKNKNVVSNRQLPEVPLQEEPLREDPVSVLPSRMSASDDDQRGSDSSSGPSLSSMAETRVKRQYRGKGRFGATAQPGPVHRAATSSRNPEGSEHWLQRRPPHVVGPAPQTQSQWRPAPYFPQPFYSHLPVYPMYFWDCPVFFMPVPPECALPTPATNAIWIPPQRAESSLDRVNRQQIHPGVSKSALGEARRPPISAGRRGPPTNRRQSSMRPSVPRGQTNVAKEIFTTELVDKTTASSSAADMPLEAAQMGSGPSVQVAPPKRASSNMESLAEPVAITESHNGPAAQPGLAAEVQLSNASVSEPTARFPECDLDEFLLKVCPSLETRGSSCSNGTTVGDVWNLYKDPSIFGLEIPMKQGPRSPTSAFYIPLLSGCRIFVPAGSEVCDEVVAQMVPYEVDTPSGRERVYAIFEHFEGGHAQLRQPLFEAVQENLGAELAERLFGLRLESIHPASWYAVRWHPLYRIPESPLRAEFLTFHSFQPVPISSTLFGAIEANKIDASRSCSGQGQRVLPIIAMRGLIPKEEGWLNPRMKLQTEGGALGNGLLLSTLHQLKSWSLETRATALAYSSGICPAEGSNNFQLEDLSADAFQGIQVA